MSSLGILSGGGVLGAVTHSCSSDDFDAINVYMSGTEAVTSQAVRLKDDWLKWWNSVSEWDKYWNREAVCDEARNRHNAFSIANTRTAAERANAERVAKTGFTIEEQHGQPSRVSSEGRFPGQFDERNKFPWIPVAVGTVLAIGLLVAARPYFSAAVSGAKTGAAGWKALRKKSTA